MASPSVDKITVSIGPRALEGFLRLPPDPRGLVIFAHGAGSSRMSTRNNQVAEALGERAMATLLFDLLTEKESRDRSNVFDIPKLSERVLDAVESVRSDPDVSSLPIGLFGSSTGAGAALVAAARVPCEVQAVVSRGGRPDLAERALTRVRAPVLLIVGGADHLVIELNRLAARRLTCHHQTEIIPGATHLFEEPGALEQVIELAGDWFETHLKTEGDPS